MTIDYSDKIPDLSESLRGSGEASLLAGSTEYQYFLQKLAAVISPDEALETRARFVRSRRLFWLTALAFLALYFILNGILGPIGLRTAAVGNDALRGMLLLAAMSLASRKHLAVAAQLLLPLASLCFLPMPITSAPDWIRGPMIFGSVAVLLLVCGWLIDLGANPRGRFAPLLRWSPLVGLLAFSLLNIAGWLWIIDQAVPPYLSLIAAAVSLVILFVGKKSPAQETDVQFLYGAAWKRWRFFITGRALAIIFGVIPFLLFTSLLDHQATLEECREAEKTPEIFRIQDQFHEWNAVFWRHEGRFLTLKDFEPSEENAPVVRGLYFVTPKILFNEDLRKIPPECLNPGHPLKLPSDEEMMAMGDRMRELNMQRMTREQFLEHVKEFEPLRITSRCRLLQQDPDPPASGFLEISFHSTGSDGVVFAEKPDFRMYNPEELKNMVERYNVAKWITLLYGILGFIFLWRRGGDSSIARWLGIWLIGASLVLPMISSDDTLPHITHWLWQQSVMYRWNTLASAAQPLFNLLFIATAAAAFGWMLQISAAVAWTHICWPTRSMPRFPPIVRHLAIIGKIAAVVFIQSMLLLLIIFVSMALNHGISRGALEFSIFLYLTTIALLVVGWILRRFTRAFSEVPRLGPWPVLALILFTVSNACYIPTIMFTDGDYLPPALLYSGAAFGCLFAAIVIYMIIKQDFLRVRAISNFATLLVLLVVPFAINQAEAFVPRILTNGPFFGEHGAELVAILLVVLLFPSLHHWLHELLLFASLPRLRRIEHTVEHALESIVDAHDESARAKMVCELFEKLQVPRYLFLSRGPAGVFIADINRLQESAPATVQLSPGLRKFLGRRRHFIDLQSIAFEWPFFFHQFELHRLAHVTACRYLLPLSVGESLRGLLLIPEGPGETVIANPAISANINNFAIAAALSRTKP